MGTHYDRGPCQKNVYKSEYLDWLKMHLKCTFQSGQRSFTKLDLEKLRLIFGYPYQLNSTKICLGMTLQTWYEVELFSNTPWEITIGEVLHWVTWLVCNIQTKPQFLIHFLKDRIYRAIWFSPENMASKFCLVVPSFISML